VESVVVDDKKGWSTSGLTPALQQSARLVGDRAEGGVG
jgi:hypothetical protein